MRTQKETAVVKLQEDTSQILDLNNTIRYWTMHRIRFTQWKGGHYYSFTTKLEIKQYAMFSQWSWVAANICVRHALDTTTGVTKSFSSLKLSAI